MLHFLPILLALAAAEPSDRGTRLPEVVVEDGRPDPVEKTAAALDRLALPTQALKLPSSGGARSASLADVLRFAPGVVAQERFGPEDLRLSIRGSGITRTGHGRGLLLLRDGVPLNTADGDYDMIAADLWASSHLAVLRGGNAGRYGATALGGAVDLQSRRASSESPLAARLQGGSFGFRRANLLLGNDWRGGDALLALSQGEADGYREQSATRIFRSLANLGLDWEGGSQLFVLGHSDDASQWPGALTLAQWRNDPRSAATLSRQRNQRNDIRQSTLSSRTRVEAASADWEMGLGFSRREQFHPTPGGISEPQARTFIVQPGVRRVWDRIEAGAALRHVRSDIDAVTRAYAGPPTSALASRPGAIVAERDQYASNLELILDGRYAMADSLSLTAGLVFGRSERRDTRITRNAPQNNRPDYRQRFQQVSPALGLQLRPSEDRLYFLALRHSFEPPSFFDLGGNAPLQSDGIPRLRAQSADTIDIGTRGRSASHAWDVTLYYSRVDAELLRLNPGSAPNPPVINAGRTVHAGLEALLETRIDRLLGWERETAWTWRQRLDLNEFRFDSDPVYRNNRLAGLPRALYRSELAYAWPLGHELALTFDATSATFADFRNQTRVPGHGVIGLRANWQVAAAWSLGVEARNLLDRRWASSTNVLNLATPTEGVVFPGDGRSVYLSLNWTWQPVASRP